MSFICSNNICTNDFKQVWVMTSCNTEKKSPCIVIILSMPAIRT
ncbi:hypothetical protein APHWI1_1530 [Anaplasma phagocytophilum str. ApWI1]|uniref:Uncharacterized protein n=1 Tax=Anaplasma phagocytophilum str. ApWI1 TaxID=1359155 RepID=A0A0F3PWR1_ANAPH|nr:hypothetical protein APHWEB_1566 [Anaplasma phagocytophilum str. Webster]KJV84331.1 hypothetical protein APHWI1_1530 [Anaplasma phagocytophilum str. ApWI1]KJV99071.1 hypothetical protein OTSANNIE_0724 [Anaplasma phagocytophilum str. Annie]